MNTEAGRSDLRSHPVRPRQPDARGAHDECVRNPRHDARSQNLQLNADGKRSGASRIDRMLAHWLSFMHARKFWVHALGAVAILVIANAVIVGAFGAQLGLGGTLVLEFAIVAVIFAIPIILTGVTLRRPLRRIFDIIANGRGPAILILLTLVSEELKAIESRIGELRNAGADFKLSDVPHWVKTRCFAVATGRYIATDAQVPSAFLAMFDDYLEGHGEYLRRTGCVTSIRVNVASRAELERDRRAHADAWAAYEDWHAKNGVELLYCDHGTALRIARDNSMGDTIDTAFWVGELALLVDYPEPDKARLRAALAGELSYQHCADFLEQVLKRSTPFESLTQAPINLDASVPTEP
jgi:hypothetical protein